jgi:cell division septation protein DedD
MPDNKDEETTKSPVEFDSESTIELDISKLSGVSPSSTDEHSSDDELDKTIDGLGSANDLNAGEGDEYMPETVEKSDDMFDLDISDLPDEEAVEENEFLAEDPAPATDELPLLESPGDEEFQAVVELTEEMLDEPENRDDQMVEDTANNLDTPELSTGENELLSEAINEFAEKNAVANKTAVNDPETPELTSAETNSVSEAGTNDVGEEGQIPEIDVEVVIPSEPETVAVEPMEEPVVEPATKPGSGGGSNTIPLLFAILGIAAGGFGAWMALDATGKVADLERRIQILSATSNNSQDHDITDIQQRLAKVERRLTGTPTLEAAAPLGAAPTVDSTPSEPVKEAVLQPLPVTPQTPISSVPSKGDWVVNISSHAKEDLATKENRRLQSLGLNSEIHAARVRERTWYRIQITGFASKDEAKAKLKSLQQYSGIKDAWIGKR